MSVRIGLVRHFPVEQKFPEGWRTASELDDWRKRYDDAAVIVGPIDVGAHSWRECLVSDLNRAVVTAKTAFPGSVEITPLLREAGYAPFNTGRLRLPVWVWRLLLRAAWLTGHKSQRAERDEFRKRVFAVADLLERREGEILVVSHAGMMAYLSRELCRRGFVGPKFGIAGHGRLYLFEKRDENSG